MKISLKIIFQAVTSLALMVSFEYADGQGFQIRLANKGMGLISVEMRDTTGISPRTPDFVTDIVFGIKWASASLDLSNNITTTYNIRKSGSRSMKIDTFFQAFYADPAGFNIPANWQQDIWVEILAIPLTGTGSGTFQITQKNFDITTDPNFALNFVDYTPVIAGSFVDAPLPVNIISFNAVPLNRMIKLQWVTDAEVNSKGFEVQRAQNEGSEFKDIGWIDSKNGDGGKNDYAYIDKEVIEKTTYHYRLKQVDIDGKYKYSLIKTAILDELDNHSITIAPNPADNLLKVFFNSGIEKGNAVLKIVDAKGVIALTQSRYLSPGSKVELNILPLAGGAYFLVIENSNGLLYQKIFKKN